MPRTVAAHEASIPAPFDTLQSFLSGRLSRDAPLYDCRRNIKTNRVQRRKDVFVAGNHYDSFYVNHDG
jgi:hypothetical protein